MLPAIPTRGLVVLPGAMRVLTVGRPLSMAAIEHALMHGGPIILAVQLDPDKDDSLHAEIAPVGTASRVLRLTRLPDGTLRVLVEGLERIRVSGSVVSVEGMSAVEATAYDPPRVSEPAQLEAQASSLGDHFSAYLTATGIPPADQELLGSEEEPPGRLADRVFGTLDLPLDQQIEALSCVDLHERLALATHRVTVALAKQKITAEIHEKLQASMDASQREYHLREQLKAIRAELGDAAGGDAEAEAFTQRIDDSGMPEAARKEALREVDRLRRAQPESAEYTVIRTWLETICDVPWTRVTPDSDDLPGAQTVLDRDHFGLDNVKERILEYLAVRKLAPESRGPILCFAGPPGVGKTSLGHSIAEALGRSYARVALGGVKDETEVRGHRRTYVGAMPGRIIRALTRAGSRNPVIVLDELDKVGSDVRGDPASALLEVLDPAQNSSFVDHYLDVDVDLSQVLFIATANRSDMIPPALRDRLEIIDIPGYTEEDKVEIARRFLLPRLGKEHGLTKRALSLTPAAIRTTIRDYTREAGVRDLERQLAKLHRKVARRVVEGQSDGAKISQRNLADILGPAQFHQELAERVDQPGVVIGLAWTEAGGDILFIEAARMPGKPTLQLTGSLGDVMKESVEAALTWLRSNAHDFGIEPGAFDCALHLHVPAGAIPKDGPSAGTAMLTSLTSLMTGRRVRSSLAMTGEMTLRGKVLPVGGIKEKALAARRAGVRTVILPRRNENDLQDIPEAIRSDLTFVLVDNVREVLKHALEPAAGA